MIYSANYISIFKTWQFDLKGFKYIETDEGDEKKSNQDQCTLEKKVTSDPKNACYWFNLGTYWSLDGRDLLTALCVWNKALILSRIEDSSISKSIVIENYRLLMKSIRKMLWMTHLLKVIWIMTQPIIVFNNLLLWIIPGSKDLKTIHDKYESFLKTKMNLKREECEFLQDVSACLKTSAKQLRSKSDLELAELSTQIEHHLEYLDDTTHKYSTVEQL